MNWTTVPVFRPGPFLPLAKHRLGVNKLFFAHYKCSHIRVCMRNEKIKHGGDGKIQQCATGTAAEVMRGRHRRKPQRRYVIVCCGARIYEKQWLEKSRQRLRTHGRWLGPSTVYTSLLWQRQRFLLPSATIRSESTFSVGPGRLLLKRSLYCHDIIGQSPRRTPIINSVVVSLLVAKSWKAACSRRNYVDSVCVELAPPPCLLSFSMGAASILPSVLAAAYINLDTL